MSQVIGLVPDRVPDLTLETDLMVTAFGYRSVTVTVWFRELAFVMKYTVSDTVVRSAIPLRVVAGKLESNSELKLCQVGDRSCLDLINEAYAAWLAQYLLADEEGARR